MATKPERIDEDSVEPASPTRPVAVFRHGASASEADSGAGGETAAVEVSVEIATTADEAPVVPAARAIFRHKSPPASATGDPAPAEEAPGRPASAASASAASRSGGWLFPFAHGFAGPNGGLSAFQFRMLDGFHASLMINLDTAERALGAASFSDLIELQSEYFRRQAETLLGQAKILTL